MTHVPLQKNWYRGWIRVLLRSLKSKRGKLEQKSLLKRQVLFKFPPELAVYWIELAASASASSCTAVSIKSSNLKRKQNLVNALYSIQSLIHFLKTPLNRENTSSSMATTSHCSVWERDDEWIKQRFPPGGSGYFTPINSWQVLATMALSCLPLSATATRNWKSTSVGFPLASDPLWTNVRMKFLK